MEFKPHGYQQKMIDFIGKGGPVALWADMGLGKTVTVLTAINERVFDKCLPTKVLVLAPKLVAEETWLAEQQKWDHLRFLKVAVVAGTPARRRKILEERHDVYVMCRNNITWLMSEYIKVKNGKWTFSRPWPFNVVVLDESSAFKNPTGSWFRTMTKILRAGPQIIELTGTPSPSNLGDLWGQVYLLDRGLRLENGIGKFRNKYLEPDKMGPNGIVYSYKARPLAYEAAMIRCADCCLSLKAEDWLKMPDRIDNIIKVDIPREFYETFKRDSVVGDVTAGDPAQMVNKLLQIANGRVYDVDRGIVEVHDAKIEALKEIVDGKPILVFYNFIHDKDAIMEAFDFAEELDVKRWNTGQCKMMLAHPASAGHGLNLQGGGNIIVWYGVPYNLEWYQQANARLYRQGQKEPSVIIHHLIAANTEEEKVVEALTRKDTNQRIVLDSVKL